jgi:hypothetical protein
MLLKATRTCIKQNAKYNTLVLLKIEFIVRLIECADELTDLLALNE